MASKQDSNILHHLLTLESEASSLVDDAQAEADRRLVEAENERRIVFEKSYAEEVEKLEKIFNEEITAAKAAYKNELSSYRDELKAQPLDMAAFSQLAGQLLLGVK